MEWIFNNLQMQWPPICSAICHVFTSIVIRSQLIPTLTQQRIHRNSLSLPLIRCNVRSGDANLSKMYYLPFHHYFRQLASSPGNKNNAATLHTIGIAIWQIPSVPYIRQSSGSSYFKVLVKEQRYQIEHNWSPVIYSSVFGSMSNEICR